MTPDEHAEELLKKLGLPKSPSIDSQVDDLRRRTDDLEKWVVRLSWLGGGVLLALILRVFFGVI